MVKAGPTKGFYFYSFFRQFREVLTGMISYNSNKMLEKMHASQYTNIATRYEEL